MTSLDHDEARIRAQACEWLVTLQDPETDPEGTLLLPRDLWIAFSTWFQQSPAHLQAFLEAVEDSKLLHNIDPNHSIDVDALLRAPEDNVVSFDGATITALTRSRGLERVAKNPSVRTKLPSPGYSYAGWAVGIVATIAVLVPTLFPLSRPGSSNPYFSSGIGQRLFVPLEDGSNIQLNTRSRVSVNFTRAVREVELLEGEALFDVRHERARPFRVVAGDVLVEDMGTKFSVYRRSSEVNVSVVNGSVEIQVTSADPSFRSMAISAGMTARIVTQGKAEAVSVSRHSDDEIARKLAWQEGRITFQGETLATAIAEINRYNAKQFLISDPALAALRLGGTFQTTDPEAFGAALTKTFDVELRISSGRPDIITIERAVPVQ